MLKQSDIALKKLLLKSGPTCVCDARTRAAGAPQPCRVLTGCGNVVKAQLGPGRDPLHCASCHAELSGDLVETWPPRSRQSFTDSRFQFHRCARAPEGFAALGAARLGQAPPLCGVGPAVRRSSSSTLVRSYLDSRRWPRLQNFLHFSDARHSARQRPSLQSRR
jgi:hypothetical protein